MSCMCLLVLTDFHASLEAVAPKLEALAPGIPAIPQLPAGGSLAGLAGGLGSLSAAASASASADLSMSASLAAGIELPSPEQLASLEAMAHVGGSLDIEPFSPTAAAQFDLAAGSINVNAPTLKAIAAKLPPLLAPLGGLQELAVTVEAVQVNLGVNLFMEGAIPQLEAALGSFDTSLAVDMAASMSAEAIASLGTLGRLINASAALGIDLGAPGGLPQLEAALDVAASLSPPPLTITVPEWTNLIGMMSSLESVNSSLGVNLMLPGASAQLEASLGSLGANLEGLDANLQLPLDVSADVSAAASFGASLNAALPAMGMGMDLGSLPTVGLGGLPLGNLPDVGDLSLAATFAASFEAATGNPLMLSAGCPNMFCVA